VEKEDIYIHFEMFFFTTKQLYPQAKRGEEHGRIFVIFLSRTRQLQLSLPPSWLRFTIRSAGNIPHSYFSENA
jgi:hypothetical protein